MVYDIHGDNSRSGADIHTVAEQIELLYSSKDPQKIQQLQNELTTFQNNDNGQLAHQLMLRPSKNCQFFGALTYTVLINKTQRFDPDTLQVLVRTLESFIYASDGIILKKLLSNLSLLYIYNFDNYRDPIGNLLTVMNLDPLGIGDNPQASSLVLMFCTILVEDLTKKEKLVVIHESVFKDIYPRLNQVYQALNSTVVSPTLDTLGLDCMSAWVNYIPIAEYQSKVRYDDVSSFIRYIFDHFRPETVSGLEIDSEMMDAINKAIGCLTDIIEINPQMLNSDMKQYLTSLLFENDLWGQRFIGEFALNLDFRQEIGNFINLIIAFMQLQSVAISKNLTIPKNQHILQFLTKLTDFPGTAIIEEGFSEQLLLFWDEFFNVFIDNEQLYEESLDSIEKESFYLQRNELCDSICTIYWRKIMMPVDFKGYDSEFLYFRSNVGDFFSNIYSLLKSPLYEKLTMAAIKQLASIQQLESTLFILYKINDDCTFYESQSNLLIPFVDQLLHHQLLETFTTSNVNNGFMLTTLINYISSIQFYFKTDRGKTYLGKVFDILFSIMLNSELKLSLNASKTIVNICQECKSSLEKFIPNLKPLVMEMVTNSKVDPLIRQRMVNSFVSVAQNELPSDFASHLVDILNTIENQSVSVMEMINTDSIIEDLETMEQYLCSLLQCIEECGKATILSDEVEELYSDENITMINNYWQTDDKNIKTMVLNIINKFSLEFLPFVNNPQITETCCQIFKIGLNEPISGPFKFEIVVILKYISQKAETYDSLSLSYLFKLIETVVITNPNAVDDLMIYHLLDAVFVDKLDTISNDPDLITSSINLFTSIIEKKPTLLLNNMIFSAVCDFTIANLGASESFVIKAVLKYWAALLLMKRGTQNDHERVAHLLVEQKLGPLLTEKLVVGFINTSRSQLDHYYPVFRQLVGKFSLHMKLWLLLVVADLNIKLNANERQAFIDKLMITRGQRTANEVLRHFWLNSNGLIDFTNKNF